VVLRPDASADDAETGHFIHHLSPFPKKGTLLFSHFFIMIFRKK
jgi:hypothetical protein